MSRAIDQPDTRCRSKGAIRASTPGKVSLSASNLQLFRGRSRDRTCDHLLVREVLYR